MPPVSRLVRPGRCDLFLPLGGEALVIADGAELDGSRREGRPLLEGLGPEPAWRAAAGRGAFLPYRLEAARSGLVVRVVLGPLAPQEADEWVGRATGALELPSGELLLSTRSDVLRGAHDEEALARVEVEPGRHAVELFLQLPGPGGERCLRAAEAAAGEPLEPFGDYLRRTRPGEEPPDWLLLELGLAPHRDPGHEEEWEAWTETDRFARVQEASEALGLGLVDVVLRLEPSPTAPATPLPPDGWVSAGTEVRKPERCPRGLPGRAFD